MTELLAQIEGLERGPAGNTSLAAAFVIAQEMDDDQVIVVQETEYTGAGKHIVPQLSFAKKNGVKVDIGNPEEEIPGQNIILPSHPSKLMIKEVDLMNSRKSYITNAVKNRDAREIEVADLEFLSEETKLSKEEVIEILNALEIKVG